MLCGAHRGITEAQQTEAIVGDLMQSAVAVEGLTTYGTPGQRFPVKYYLTAMLFIVFDIEIVFLYPWAVSYDALGTFALAEMVVFILTVFVAYAYVWRRGGLTWD